MPSIEVDLIKRLPSASAPVEVDHPCIDTDGTTDIENVRLTVADRLKFASAGFKFQNAPTERDSRT